MGSMGKKLHSEADKAFERMAKMRAGIEATLAELKKTLPALEARYDKILRDKRALKFRIDKFIANGLLKEEAANDPEYQTLKDQYMDVAYELQEVDQTIMMVEEAIAEMELSSIAQAPTQGDELEEGPQI